MILESLAVGPFSVNAYLVADDATGHAAIVDPGDDVERIVERVRTLGVTPRIVLATHGHLAHVARALDTCDRFSVPFGACPGDAELLAALPERAILFGLPPSAPPRIDVELEDGAAVALGERVLEIFGTPGHSPGSVCFFVRGHAGEPGAVLTGDVLFRGSVGRTDVPGGSDNELARSIRERLYPLGDETVVLPGHGPATTIGEERRTNPFLAGPWVGGRLTVETDPPADERGRS